MKEAKFISNPYLYIIVILFPAISSIALFFSREFAGATASLVITIVFCIPLICLRKKFFAKMLIDDAGIKIFYQKK